MSLLDDHGVRSSGTMLERARAGDVAAFGTLYELHLGAARRLARQLLVDASDADDVVAEVFAATFAAMRRGHGPVDDFRPYVLRAVRHECHRTWRRGARQRPGGDHVAELAATRTELRDDIEQHGEDEIVHRAFRAMPVRMRDVLWSTEIEGHSHAEIAERTGSTPAAVAQLATRARKLFGERYLAEHVPAPPAAIPVDYAATRRGLAEVVRGTASATKQRAAGTHLAACTDCAAAAEHLEIVNQRLRSGHVLALLPAIVAAKPVRIGVLARLAAWFAGSTPAITASVTIVLGAAVIVGPELTTPVDAAPPATTVPAPAVAPVDPSPAPGTATARAPGVVPAPAGAVPTAPPAATTPATPTTPAALTPPVDVPTTPPAEPAGVVDAGAVTEPVGVVVERGAALGPTLDGVVAGATAPVLAVLPPVDVSVTLPPTPAIGPIEPVGPVALDVSTGDGAVGVDVAVGPAAATATVGGPTAARVELPPVGAVVDALPVRLPLLGG